MNCELVVVIPHCAAFSFLSIVSWCCLPHQSDSSQKCLQAVRACLDFDLLKQKKKKQMDFTCSRTLVPAFMREATIDREAKTGSSF